MTMAVDRRGFLRDVSLVALAAAGAEMAGCASFGSSGAMSGFRAAPMPKIRLGFIGIGERGLAAVSRVTILPGIESAAFCDLRPERVDLAVKNVTERKLPGAKRRYEGREDSWKGLCDDPGVDVVYIATPAGLHPRIALYAMRAGKHVLTEVPASYRIEELWEIVETSETTRRHCMMLENCCYGEMEMLALNLCKLGLLGDLVHGEGAYIHDLRQYNYGTWDDATARSKDTDNAYWNFWRLRHNSQHKGNQYTTHGLGPLCWYMDINRGDRFDYLVSLESEQRNFEAYAKANFPKDWRATHKVEMGDMNTMLIKTKLGRSIMIQHDVSSPRPYSRINTITGTKGILADYPYRVGWEEKSGGGVHKFFDEKRAAEVREQYKHPLWKQAGELAKRMGGHGGMDFLMVLRLAYCLQNGLPLDENVYDLASWCCLCELSEKSVRSGSEPQSIPDFTCGGWRTAKPIGDLSIDLGRMGFKA